MSSTPLTLAETASVFGEMLTFRALLDAETDPARRRRMLAGKVEDMLNTVVRQIAFYRFETLLHDERAGGELLPERIGELCVKVQTERPRPGLQLHRRLRRVLGLRAAFRALAVLCLRVRIRGLPGERAVRRVRGRPSRLPEKYVEMLKAGGTRRHQELLAPFGLTRPIPILAQGARRHRGLHRRPGPARARHPREGYETSQLAPVLGVVPLDEVGRTVTEAADRLLPAVDDTTPSSNALGKEHWLPWRMPARCDCVRTLRLLGKSGPLLAVSSSFRWPFDESSEGEGIRSTPTEVRDTTMTATAAVRAGEANPPADGREKDRLKPNRSHHVSGSRINAG